MRSRNWNPSQKFNGSGSLCSSAGILRLFVFIPQFSMFLVAMVLTSMPAVCLSQTQAPQYEDCRLDSIFPAGAQRGTTIWLELKGHGNVLQSARDLVIDGPPGIKLLEFKPGDNGLMNAQLEIAADAAPGRRWLRVLNERSGLTNYAHFVISRLPEVIEKEPNNELSQAMAITTPVVINARITPKADIDTFRFSGKRGEKLVAAISSATLDVHGQGRDYGMADLSLELLDNDGRTLASSEDVLGLDPLLEHTLSRDGDYVVRVTMLNYGGFPDAVYRLTLGEVPFVVGAFPSGVRRGAETEVELFGPNVPAGTKRRLNVATDESFPLTFAALDTPNSSGFDVPLVVSLNDFPEQIEVEPNNVREQAVTVTWPANVNARFQETHDADWYRMTLAAQQKVWLEVTAQRFTQSPVDTLIQVFDSNGQMLTENDDDSHDPEYESFHSFRTTDSKLLFTAPTAGDFFVKVTEQSGVFGVRAVYRLTVSEARPDFHVRHFPDAVPIWGPGSTAAVLVKVDRFADFEGDVECSIAGLPEGWKSSTAVSLGRIPERYYNNYQRKVFLSITAPADAAVGTLAPFRIIARAKRGDEIVERRSWPLNLFFTSDIGFFRTSQQTRAVVAKSPGPWLEAITSEVKLKPGETGIVQVKVHGAAADLKEMSLIINLATNGVACGLTTPQNIPIKDGIAEVPLKLPAEMPIGRFGIVAAQSWRSDIRTGMPGPCTSLIRMTVLPK